MLLGAGELGKEVIIALQRLGVEVIAVDRYAHAPGHHVAHRFHVIDMTDPSALRALVELEKPHLIVPEIEAIATDELARIEKDGLARVIPTARATQLTMNREGIRRLVAEELFLNSMTTGVKPWRWSFASFSSYGRSSPANGA
jgi:phosphoribosylglycinamide formyltransferase 2